MASSVHFFNLIITSGSRCIRSISSQPGCLLNKSTKGKGCLYTSKLIPDLAHHETTSETTWPSLLTGAALWGTVGLFIAPLKEFGFSTTDIAILRMGGSFLVMLPLLLAWRPSLIRLKKLSDVKYFVLTGTLSLGFFQWFYLSAIQELGMSMAVVLLYTAPAMVVVMARFAFWEAITPGKIIAILIMISGCALVLELPSELRYGDAFSTAGAMLGLGAAFCFALYNLTSKFALKHYRVTTVIWYTFLFATAGLIPFSSLFQPGSVSITLNLTAYLWIAGIVLITSILAYGLYINGLRQLESGRATVGGVMEIASAVTLGVLLTGDSFNAMSATGLVLVITAVLIISKPKLRRGKF